MNKLLSVFSYIFHPLFISVYAVLLYFFLTDRFHLYQEFFLIIIQVLILTILIPISVFYFLISIGKANNIMLSKVEQRKIPLSINCVLLLLLIEKSLKSEFIPELYFFFFGALVSSVLLLLMTFVKLKASIHMVGMSALAVFTIGMSLKTQTNHLYLIATFLFLTGLVASSRLVMKAHSGLELTAGFFTGLLPQFLLLYFWI
ncbi:hypothetical protein GV828_06830 [Flavobacterium sp. NST-5]|uniref:Transmembrane protein n=1 Tax=Flavobacterium ichthyis TaxID=2698827 RepID=A0ABW9Z7Q8_9FLAO|nr:hypothetical protein [Flavobacterium ichthyis]NBL64911.1 hypothetical protein [Flavobacterium ichthyis]